MTSVVVAEMTGALSGLSGVLPRRAVMLDDGSLADKVKAPLATEIAQISVVCEVLRRELGEHVFSRHTPHLLAQCVAVNEEGAWRAMLDDDATGDLDTAAVSCFFGGERNSERFAGLVQCLVAAETGMHMWMVIRAMQCVMPVVDQAATRRLGIAFQHRFPDIVRCISRRVRDISVDMRAGAITTLGKLMVWCDIPIPNMCGMLTSILKGADDVLRLFLFAPIPDLVQHDPDLVLKVLAKAERASQATKYPPCALLALMTADQLRPVSERVSKVVQVALDTAAAQGSMEPRLVLVCGVLAKVVAPPRSLHASLAHALCCMALSNDPPA